MTKTTRHSGTENVMPRLTPINFPKRGASDLDSGASCSALIASEWGSQEMTGGELAISKSMNSPEPTTVPVLTAPDTLLRMAILAGVFVLDLALFPLSGLSLSWGNAVAPLAVLVTLGTVALVYERRGAPQLVLVAIACLQLLLFTAAFTLLMYAAASLGRPLADTTLAASDAAVGFSTLACWRWAQAHENVNLLLNLAYHSVMPQMLLIVLLLGMRGRRVALSAFVLRYMVCLLLTLLVFAAVPAEGPFVAPEFTPNASQTRYLEQLRGVRDGSLTRISLAESEGLITFPSFHTSLALLLAMSAGAMGSLRWPLVIVNLLVIVATITSGWHYATDVLAGAIVALCAVWLAQLLESRFVSAGRPG